MTMSLALRSALIAVAVAAVPASATNLLINGGFETFSQPIPAGYYNVGSGGDNAVPGDFGWSVPVNNVDVVTNGAYGPFNAGGGAYVLDLVGYGSTGAISQTIDTVNGKAYAVFLRYAKNNGASAPSADVSVDGNVIGSFTGTNTFKGFYTTFVGTGAPTVFAITSTTGGGGSGGAFIDSVSVSAVPEAATWAMLLTGFGMVGFAARRRHTAVAA